MRFRGAGGVGTALAALLAGAALAAPAAAAPGDVPETEEGRAALVRCDADLGARPKAPVVLVHGTMVTADVNWSWGYAQDLRRRGHGICVFDLPRYGAIDVQDSVLLTVAAIRKAFAEGGGRRVSLIGHSQGGAHITLAPRMWPELAPMIEDVIGLAGVYDEGSEPLGEGCRRRCIPAFHQFAPGSKLLTALRRFPLPAGIDMTAIGTLFDDTVAPQPRVNQIAGGRSMQLQDVCPGRRTVPSLDHIYLAVDAVAHAMVLDALEHDGPTDPARISPVVCALPVFATIDPVGFAAVVPELLGAFDRDLSAEEVAEEPPLRCPLADGCGAAAPVVASARPVRTTLRRGARLALRVRATAPARLRVVAGRATLRSATVAAGRRTVRLVVPRRPGRHTVTVQARPAAGGTWTAVRTLRLRVLAR